MMFTQYMFNTQSFNPAYVGTPEHMSVVALAREQWAGFDGAPASQTITLNIPFKKRHIGLGFSLANDAIGPIQQMGFDADFSYIINLSKTLKLSMGIKASFAFLQTDLVRLKSVDINDPSLSKNLRGDFMPNFGAGLYLYSDKFYVGASTPTLVKNKISIDNDAVSTQGEQEIHGFFTGGYAFEISRDLVFRPSVLVKYVYAAPLSVDLAGNFLIKERLWLGASYRIGDAISGIVQYGITENLWLGYSYGYSLSDLMNYNSGTHEIMLSYDFAFQKKRFKSPRYF